MSPWLRVWWPKNSKKAMITIRFCFILNFYNYWPKSRKKMAEISEKMVESSESSEFSILSRRFQSIHDNQDEISSRILHRPKTTGHQVESSMADSSTAKLGPYSLPCNFINRLNPLVIDCCTGSIASSPFDEVNKPPCKEWTALND